MGLSIIGTGKRLFPFPKLPVLTHPLDRLPEVQRPGHEPEVRNEWSGASIPLLRLHVGLRDSTFARVRQYVSSGVRVGQYKRGLTWIYIKGEHWGVFNCFMKE